MRCNALPASRVRESPMTHAWLLAILALAGPACVVSAPQPDGALSPAAAVALGLAIARARQNGTNATDSITGSQTLTATAAWATQTTGGMTQSSDEDDTIVVHSDAGLT